MMMVIRRLLRTSKFVLSTEEMTRAELDLADKLVEGMVAMEGEDKESKEEEEEDRDDEELESSLS